MDEIIIEKQENKIIDIDLELNQNTLITELKNLEVTPSSQEQTFKAGTGAFKEVKIKGDENLISENIKSGETIFGVEGNKNVVDTSDATATSSKIHPDCDAYVKGTKLKGKMTVWNDTNPRCIPTHQKIINPESPFILTRQQTTGSRYEEIIKIPADVIDPTWLEGKNICIRANYNPNLTYWSKDWRIEIATVNEGGKFFFKVYSGGYMEIWARNAANKTTNYTLYTANVDSIDELTINSWKKKDVVADGYTNGDLGPIGTLYAYSRDDSGKTTGLTGSSGVPGSTNKFILKSNNSKTGYTEANAEFYSEIPYSDLVKKIGLKAENVKKNVTYLGVTGTLADNNASMEVTSTTFNIKTALTKIDKVNMTSITNFSSAFADYVNLKEANFTGERIRSSSNSNMFKNCTSLTKITGLNFDLLSRDNSNFSSAFEGCAQLENVDLTSYNNSSNYKIGINNMASMFKNCNKLKELPTIIQTYPKDGKPFSTNAPYAFQNCSSLTSVENIYITNYTPGLFQGCTNLKTVKGFKTLYGSNEYSRYLFQDCVNLETVEIEFTNPSSIVGILNWFTNCNSLKTIPDAIVNLTTLVNGHEGFKNCSSLTEIPEKLFINNKIINIYNMFNGCTNLITVPVCDFSALGSNNTTFWQYAFANCPNLSDESLNNLMYSFTNSPISYQATMSNIGFSANQIERCKTLSNYQAFINAGWQAI